MEEDIKRLEGFVELCFEEIKKKDKDTTAILNIDDIIALRNVLHEYKELKLINEEDKKINGELREELNELEEFNFMEGEMDKIVKEASKINHKAEIYDELLYKVKKDMDTFLECVNNTCVLLVKEYYRSKLAYAQEIFKILKGENDA